MRRRTRWLRKVTALVSGCLAGVVAQPAPCAEAQERAAQPNVVLILADDLGWADLGVYGSTFHETPHLDRLAQEGMRFTAAYAAASICSPTRASLLTGRYPARLHQTDWIPGQRNEPGNRFLQVEDHNHLPLREVTLAEELRRAGYATSHIGKWHLGEEGHRPVDQGFDLQVAVNDYGSPPTYFWPYRGGGRDLDQLAATGREGENLTDRLGEEAAKFIAAHHDRPFFLYLPFYAVHTPLEGKAELVAKYQAKATAMGIPDERIWGTEHGFRSRQVQTNSVFAAMVETMDAAVGRVLEALEQSGIAERTIVIFLSDNGGLSVLASPQGRPPTSNLPLRAGKGWLYEGGIRIPQIVRWPGFVRPGSISEVPVSTVDLFSTVLEVVGVDAPAGVAIDGVSLVPLLQERAALTREALYWHYPHYHGSGSTPSSAVRSGRYKLIEWIEDDRIELYDLQEDPGERRDLVASLPEVAADLRARLRAWRRSVDAQMPEPNPEHTRR